MSIFSNYVFAFHIFSSFRKVVAMAPDLVFWRS